MRYQTKPADNLSQTVSHFRYKDLHQCRLEREQSPKMRMLSKGKPRSCSVAKERRERKAGPKLEQEYLTSLPCFARRMR